jgi:uncharacterized protein
MIQPQYIYLHGFASSPASLKARYLMECFEGVGLKLTVPDLNLDDFSHLTISRQINQVVDLLPRDKSPVVLIGSSLGGLTARVLAQNYPQIARLILLAPAFDFLSHWLPKIGAEKLNLWARDRYLPIYHYGQQKLLPLHHDFIIDADRYHLCQSDRLLPTLIVHGTNDDVVPIASSRDFAAQHPLVKLLEVDSDHNLTNFNYYIWQEICKFCYIY